MNIVEVIGNLGKDPESKILPNGMKVTTLSIADSKKNDETMWWKVTIWGDRFDKMLPHLKKGSMVLVSGEMSKPEIYTNKEGANSISLQISCEVLRFLPGKKSQEESKPVHAVDFVAGKGADRVYDDELPF